MARRGKSRTASRRRGASRAGAHSPPLAWFLGGLVLGLAIAAFLFVSGYVPVPRGATGTDERPVAQTEPQLIEDTPTAAEGSAARYDFFTVLPEMEVVVPERELSDQSGPRQAPQTVDAASAYILQAGSFRNAADADQMKARLALHGWVADIQQVTVNGETWHRVRIGPIQGARAADEMRRKLQDNEFDVLVLKASG